MNGMFAIGGPPVVIYFMQSEKDSQHYLATISAYFVISGLASVIMKGVAGFITVNVLWGILFGLAGLIAGSLLGKLTRSKINPELMKKAVYGIMALSGLIYVINTLI